jgi:hypothetical protein
MVDDTKRADYCEKSCRPHFRQKKEPTPCETCEHNLPDLNPANAEAFELWNACNTQLRVGGMGFPVGLDYQAMFLIAAILKSRSPPIC